MAEVFKVPAPVEAKRRPKRAASPQPSTSTVPALSPAEQARRHVMQSVYAHLSESIHLNDIGQLRGLKTGRRHWRRRGIHQMSLPMRVSNAIKLIEPFLMSEIVVQQSQHTLVATALDHFANVVNHIVEQEGCGTPLKPPAPFCKRAEIKRLFAEFDSENMTDGKGGTMTLLPIDDEVDTKDLPVQVETAAAVVAIVLGEKNIAGDSIDVIN